MTPTTTPTWDEVRRIRDEVRLKLHLAGMDARDRWHALEPRLVEIEHAIETRGRHASDVLSDQLAFLGIALRNLRAEIVDELDPERPR